MCNYGTAFVVIAILLAFLIFLQVNAVWSRWSSHTCGERDTKNRRPAALRCICHEAANNSVVVLVCESRLQLIMMPSEHQRIIWVLTNLLHKVGS